MNYYNEFDPYAAQWLRNLIDAGHIPKGEVDSRSIKDVKASDLTGFVQCHFFAGLGGWSHALRLAGWPEDRPVWTGSCPCQPFSAAGAGGGVTDERHLWPVWFNLIRECRPDVIFGEQVEAAINHGWLDLVQSDLEGEGYACGAVGIPAGGVGAPHIRQRLWFVADTVVGGRASKLNARGGNASISGGEADGQSDCGVDQLGIAQSAGRRTGGEYERGVEMGGGRSTAQRGATGHQLDRTDTTDNQLADTAGAGRKERQHRPGEGGRALESGECEQQPSRHGATDQLAYSAAQRPEEHDSNKVGGVPVKQSIAYQLADGQCAGLEGHAGDERNGDEPGRVNAQQARSVAPSSWSDCDWLPCRDGKARPVEPGTFPLAHGVSGRVGRLRAYGNAIVPQVAQTFIEAYLES